MVRRILGALAAAVVTLSGSVSAVAAPTVISVTIPLSFGGHRGPAATRPVSPAEVRAEQRLRLMRYGLQLADAVISAIGYHAYARCLSCLAYPGGGPRGGAPLSVADFNGGRPAEVDPLVQPFSRGGFLSLAVGTVAYDVVDARIEQHWPTERREWADLAEIGAHAWGISTWLPELKRIHRDAAIAAACGAQWQAEHYGEAFSDGCVNTYYRAGSDPAPSLPGAGVVMICAPAQFKPGTFLFAAPGGDFVASGTACSNVRPPFP
jgi:hypothetical protein